jgi:hypothetical protein
VLSVQKILNFHRAGNLTRCIACLQGIKKNEQQPFLEALGLELQDDKDGSASAIMNESMAKVNEGVERSMVGMASAAGTAADSMKEAMFATGRWTAGAGSFMARTGSTAAAAAGKLRK